MKLDIIKNLVDTVKENFDIINEKLDIGKEKRIMNIDKGAADRQFPSGVLKEEVTHHWGGRLLLLFVVFNQNEQID